MRGELVGADHASLLPHHELRASVVARASQLCAFTPTANNHKLSVDSATNAGTRLHGKSSAATAGATKLAKLLTRPGPRAPAANPGCVASRPTC
jgi:hypothetical protein